MAQTMLMDSKLMNIFCTHEVHTTIHIQNRVMLRKTMKKNPTTYGKEAQKQPVHHDTSKKPRNFYFSNQVYQINAKEVQNGRLQTSYHSHANQLQVEQR
jgi:hypothetical protein